MQFEPDPTKIEHERIVMEIEETGALHMDAETARDLLVLLNYAFVKIDEDLKRTGTSWDESEEYIAAWNLAEWVGLA